MTEDAYADGNQIKDIIKYMSDNCGGGGGGGSSEIIYDVEEHEIGKWRQMVDGVKKQKPLYQKTFIFTASRGAFEKAFAHHIVDWHGNYTRTNGLQGCMPYFTNASDYFIVYKDSATNDLIQYQAGNDGADVELIISYTKTTDQWQTS